MSLKCSDYYPGLLKHRVTFQREGDGQVPDGQGGYSNPWTDVVSDWVNMGPMSGRESFFAQQLQMVISGRCVLRYRPGLLPSMRILFGTREINIRAIINVEEANRWLVIYYDEGVAT